jgi:hypothetical protein
MINGKEINISDLSPSATKALTVLKTKNGKGMTHALLRKHIVRSLKVSDTTANNIIKELRLANQLGTTNYYNISIGR